LLIQFLVIWHHAFRPLIYYIAVSSRSVLVLLSLFFLAVVSPSKLKWNSPFYLFAGNRSSDWCFFH